MHEFFIGNLKPWVHLNPGPAVHEYTHKELRNLNRPRKKLQVKVVFIFDKKVIFTPKYGMEKKCICS